VHYSHYFNCSSRIIYLLLLTFGFTFQSYSQEFEKELRTAIQENPKFELRFDSRNSFINQSGVRVYGIKAGVQFDNKLSFGLGYNQLRSSIKNIISYKGVLYNTEIKFYHLSPYLEYVFYKDEHWELSIPVQFGFGSSFYENKEDFGPEKIGQQFIISYEPAITFQYRFLRYFGAGMGIGYRLMLKPNSEVDEKFTSPVYIFKTKIYFQDILRDLKGI